MEEMINQDFVKQLRSDKCWSQEHLALVSGISLRTVQRIENEGKCSLESKKALAAAFNLNVTELNVKPNAAVLATNDSKLNVATSWLESIDSGEYNLSWNEAAPLLKNQISSIEWGKLLTQIRTPLGKVISRSIKSASEHTSLAGVPDGQYIVITLETSYELKQSALETVTLSKTDHDWRVAGYFIN